MENQINVGDQNNQQVGQTSRNKSVDVPRTAQINYWMISTVILAFLLVGVSALYFFNFKSEKNNTNIAPAVKTQEVISPSPIPTTEPTTACNVNDESFCFFLETIKQDVQSESFQTLVNYQKTLEVTCDDKTRAAQGLPTFRSDNLCKGIPEGEQTKGYYIGYNQSEGITMTAQEYVATLKNYFVKNKPFKYVGSVAKDNKGYIVYVNTNAQSLFALPVKKYKAEWKIEGITLGVVSTDFTTVDPVILNYIK